MDTKSKNSRKTGIIVVVIFLSICSMIMMSQYGNMKYAVQIPRLLRRTRSRHYMRMRSYLSAMIWQKAISFFIMSIPGRLIRLKCWMNMDREISI